MRCRHRYAKVNVKALVILLVVVVGSGIALIAARQVRRSILSNTALAAGTAAFEAKDWPVAGRELGEYLGRNPDDVEILKKYAEARLSIRPLTAANVAGAAAAYRRVLRLDPGEAAVYDRLTTLYGYMGNFEELAYVARMWRDRDPNNLDPNSLKAPLALAKALEGLNKSQEARQTLDDFRKKLEEPSAAKCVEYVQACIHMSALVSRSGSREATGEALKSLNQAVAYEGPGLAWALIHRAKFYRDTPGITIASLDEEAKTTLGYEDPQGAARLGTEVPRLDAGAAKTLARQDMDRAASLEIEDPRLYLLLGAEWLAHEEPDRAAAALQAAKRPTPEMVAKHFLDPDDWRVIQFQFALELALHRRAVAEGVSLAEEALAAFSEERHRMQILPRAVPLYVETRKIPEARRYLDEYLGMLRGRRQQVESPQRLAVLQALVELAENKPYAAINLLRPVAVSNSSDPLMGWIWRSLADAYRRTDQNARALQAQLQCFRMYPRDPQTLWELAQQYARMGNWKEAFEKARALEAAGASDPATRLLRIQAGINLAIGPQGRVDAATLQALSTELDSLRQAQPHQVDIRVLQARISWALERPQEVEQRLKLAIAECNEPLNAEMALVDHYLRDKRLSEAVDICTAACQRHPQLAAPWLRLAELQAADSQTARRSLRQGLEAVGNPREKRSIDLRLAWLDLTSGDRAAGIRLLRDLAAQDANDVQIRSWLLEVPEIQADPNTADRIVAELKKIEGESGVHWRVHQASLWLSSPEWQSQQRQIANLLQYCIEADPMRAGPVVLLAALYERQGDVRRAEDIYRQALAQNPSAVDVAHRLLALLSRQNRFAEADKVLRQTQANPRLADAWRIPLARGTQDYARAIDELKLKVSGDAQDVGSRIQLAQLIYQATKDARPALGYLKEAEAIAPHVPILVATKAEILRAEGQTEEARRILDEYVAGRNDFYAYTVRASHLAQEGKSQEAESDYRKLTTFAQEGAAGYRLLADFYHAAQRRDEAIAALEEGLKAYPGDLQLSRGLMQLLFDRAQGKDRERALEILKTLERQQPEDLGLMMVGAQQIKGTDPTAAQKKLEEIIRRVPTAVEAHLLLIDLMMEQKQYPAARDYANRALSSNLNHPAFLAARAKAEFRLENFARAAELAGSALREDPNNIDALMVLAEAGRASENVAVLNDARAKVEAALRNARFPAPVQMHLRLAAASLRFQTGDAEGAEKAYREVLTQDPNHMQALNDLAWVLQERSGRYEDALDLANRSLALAPDNMYLLDTRATILSKMPDRLAEAKRDFEKLVELSSANPGRQAKTLLQLGRVCAKLNDPAAAQQHFQAALKIDNKGDVLKPEERAEIEAILGGKEP